VELTATLGTQTIRTGSGSGRAAKLMRQDQMLIHRGKCGLTFMLRAFPLRKKRIAMLTIQRVAEHRPAAPDAVPL